MLDAGCGRGRIINRLAELYPKSRFTGMDLSSEAILSAWQEAADKKLRNVEFIVADLSRFDETAEIEAFDFITTFDAVHDQAKPLNVLRGIHRSAQARWRLPDAGHQGFEPRFTKISIIRSDRCSIPSRACTA